MIQQVLLLRWLNTFTFAILIESFRDYHLLVLQFIYSNIPSIHTHDLDMEFFVKVPWSVPTIARRCTSRVIDYRKRLFLFEY
jgi:hypothetical protein